MAFPKGAFSKVEDVLDRPVISNMLLEEPVLEGRLAAGHDQGGRNFRSDPYGSRMAQTTFAGFV